MLRAWHSAEGVVDAAVPVTAGAVLKRIDVTTVKEGVENQTERLPYLKHFFHVHRCGSFDFAAQPAHHCDCCGFCCQY